MNSRNNDQALSTKHKREGDSEIQEMRAIQHSGPLPHPDVLRGYSEIDPSFPERVMKMAEENNSASIKHEEKLIEGSLSNQRLGIILNFIICGFGLCVAALLGYAGMQFGAASAVICSLCPGIVSLIGNFVSGKKDK